MILRTTEGTHVVERPNGTINYANIFRFVTDNTTDKLTLNNDEESLSKWGEIYFGSICVEYLEEFVNTYIYIANTNTWQLIERKPVIITNNGGGTVIPSDPEPNPEPTDELKWDGAWKFDGTEKFTK